MIIPPRPEWQQRAACRGIDPAVFFEGRPAVAIRHCQGCPVVVECHDEAMNNPQLLGVWGGTTDRQRQQHRRQQQHPQRARTA